MENPHATDRFQRDRQKLVKLLRTGSVLEGEFRLSSGRTSDYLIDVSRTVLHPPGAELIGRCMLHTLRKTYSQIEGVGGLELGAVALAVAVVDISNLQHDRVDLQAFIVRKAPKEHGTKRRVEASAWLRDGARVLVLEDVLTTGLSAARAVWTLREEGYEPVGVLALVDRQEGAIEHIRATTSLPVSSVLTGAELKWW